MTPASDLTLHVAVRRGGRVEWSGVLAGQTMVIGRSPRSDVVLEDNLVSWTHAIVRVDARAGLLVTDRSSNGTFHRGQRIGDLELGAGGTLDIPPFTVELSLQGWVQEAPYVETVPLHPEPPPVVPDAGTGGPTTAPSVAAAAALRIVEAPGPLRGRSFVLSNGPNTIGRATDCQVCLDLRTISRYHARLTPSSEGRWRLQDAGSQNGIEVNGRLVQNADVGDGDRIGIGTEVVAVLESRAAAPVPGQSTGVESLVITSEPSPIEPRVTMVRVAGRVDAYTADYLREQVFQRIDRGQLHLVVDCAKCTYCDHAGLAVLVNAHVALRQKKGAICLTGLNAQLRDAFVLLRLDQILAVAPGEAEAVARVAPR